MYRGSYVVNLFKHKFSLCITIEKQISIGGRRHLDYIFWGILDPAAVQDCTYYTPTISERHHQRSMLPALGKTS